MTYPDDRPTPLDDYLHTFGERYTDAVKAADASEAKAPSRARPRVRRLMPALGLGSVLATGAIVYAVVALPVGDRLDAIQEASAAFGTSGQILHYETQTTSSDSGPGAGSNMPAGCTKADLDNLVTQVWQTTSGPTRWHMIWPTPKSPTCTQPGPDGNPLTGNVESAQHGTVQSTYFDDLRLLSSMRVKETKPSGAVVLGSVVGGGSQDLVASLREMLRSGKMKVKGAPHEQDGHEVVDLVATQFTHKDRDAHHPNLDLTQTTTYTVDSKSFTPLQLEHTESFVRDAGKYKGDYRLTWNVKFLVWERLEKTPATEALLSIQPGGPTRSKIPDSEKTPEQRAMDKENAKYFAEYKRKHPDEK